MEQVAEFPLEQRASHGRLAWAAKDRIVEELSTGAKLTKRAPRYPVYIVAQLEKVVRDAVRLGLEEIAKGLGT